MVRGLAVVLLCVGLGLLTAWAINAFLIHQLVLLLP